MSTRANIIVEDEYNRIQLYRHSDGYPDTEWGVLADLPKAIIYAWELPRFEASDFSAAIVRAWKKSGGNIYIDGNPKAYELIHGDVEWVYVVKMVEELELVVDVYQTGSYPEEHDWELNRTVVLWAKEQKG